MTFFLKKKSVRIYTLFYTYNDDYKLCWIEKYAYSYRCYYYWHTFCFMTTLASMGCCNNLLSMEQFPRYQRRENHQHSCLATAFYILRGTKSSPFITKGKEKKRVDNRTFLYFCKMYCICDHTLFFFKKKRKRGILRFLSHITCGL